MTADVKPSDAGFLDRVANEGLFEPGGEAELVFLPRWAVLCSLPVVEPKPGQVWPASAGRFEVQLSPRRSCDAGRPWVGLPYGASGRLALAAISTAVVRMHRDARHVKVCEHVAPWMRHFGKRSAGRNGGQSLLRDQVSRWLQALVTVEDGRGWTIQSPWVAVRFDEQSHRERDILSARWRVNPSYRYELEAHAIPVDLRALRAFGRDVLAMDLYLWSSYRAWSLRAPLRLQWRGAGGLLEQLGRREMGGEGRKNIFRARRALERVRVIYRGLRLETDGEGLLLHPSPPAVVPRERIAYERAKALGLWKHR